MGRVSERMDASRGPPWWLPGTVSRCPRGSNERTSVSGTAPRARVLVLLALICGGAHAADPQPAYYAGLAYLGDFAYVDENYPLARALDGPERALDRRLRAAVRELRPEHLELRHELADLDRDGSAVIAVALDRERVSRELVALRGRERTKLILDVSAQILLFDLRRGILLANVPVAAAVNHVLDGDVDRVGEASLQLARQLYMGDEHTEGLLAAAAAGIERFRPPQENGLRFQLASLDVHEGVRPLLPEGLEARRLGQRLGQAFSARLESRTGVDVIPFTRGYAIGNQLPGRFANGEAFDLRLPEPDYAFRIELRSLTRHDQGDREIFGAQARFELVEPFTGTVAIRGDYRMGIYKIARDLRLETDDWSAYEDAAESLFDELVEQLRAPDRGWHRTHARAPDSYDQFRATRELFDD